MTKQDICSSSSVNLFLEGDLFETQPKMPAVIIDFFVAYLSLSEP
jgi:hypothetical protein